MRTPVLTAGGQHGSSAEAEASADHRCPLLCPVQPYSSAQRHTGGTAGVSLLPQGGPVGILSPVSLQPPAHPSQGLQVGVLGWVLSDVGRSPSS